MERAHADIDRWFKVDHDQWLSATQRFLAALASLYPPDWPTLMDLLRHGDALDIEPVLAFLEADTRCFRTGYERERLCRLLPRAALTDGQRRQLLAVVTRMSPDRPGREQRAFAQLVSKLDSAGRN
ncbi:MAG TPA: hypothetical protein PLV13_06980 [Ilumatobacteraceae bacterium]|nr:hypothetical protein [Ilumatobacteraceae bacterium]